MTMSQQEPPLPANLEEIVYARIPKAREGWSPQHIRAAFEQACQVALTAYPGLGLDSRVFVERILGLMSAPAEPHADLASWIGERCVADLYLATACAVGNKAALSLFDAQLIARVPSFVSRLHLSPDLIDEVKQTVRTKLLVGTAAKGPALADYEGRGSLASWVRVSAARVGMTLLDARKQHPQENESVADELLAPDTDVELAYLKTRYRAVFKEALADAILELTPEQRNLLRMSVIGGLTTIQLAALFSVNQSTIVRRLQAAKEQLGRSTQKLLRERLHLDKEAFDSMVRLVQSQLDASIERLLQERPRPPEPPEQPNPPDHSD